ncbi:hypothetical protein LXA43DRAFT_1094145 [Ganoderma leucocontextum]|nr:hypothetical protein LXA43DRAFT_1094145 [Ganoderma leucocontextum]
MANSRNGPETVTNSSGKWRGKTNRSPTRPPTPGLSKRPPKRAAEDPSPPAKKRTCRRIAGPSVAAIPNPSTRFSIAKPSSSAAASSSKSAGKKRVADDCEEDTALSAKKTRSSIVTSRKKRVAAPPTRKVKKVPVQEELEALRAALPPAIRSHLNPPRDDKGPIPAKGRTFGEFLRWRTMYNDELVKRITDEEHVTCKHCGSSFALCHDTAYNWYKWGRHRRCCIRGVDPDEVAAPVLLDQLLPRCTGHPAVDMLFPKEKGGPYYKLSWTYFVPRPGQSRPDDPQEAPAPSASTLSARPSDF